MNGITLSASGSAAKILEGAMSASQLQFVRKFAKTLEIFPKREGFDGNYVYDVLVTTNYSSRAIVIPKVKVSRRLFELHKTARFNRFCRV